MASRAHLVLVGLVSTVIIVLIVGSIQIPIALSNAKTQPISDCLRKAIGSKDVLHPASLRTPSSLLECGLEESNTKGVYLSDYFSISNPLESGSRFVEAVFVVNKDGSKTIIWTETIWIDWRLIDF